MASPTSSARTLDSAALPSDEGLDQAIQRFDHAHQLLTELAGTTPDHPGGFVARTPVAKSTLAKESPSTSTAVELSPRSERPMPLDTLPEFEEPIGDARQLRDAHVAELLTSLQVWSDDLDQRAAKLHADIAIQERRERAFRLWMQQQRLELQEQQVSLQHEMVSRQAAARREFFGATQQAGLIDR